MQVNKLLWAYIMHSFFNSCCVISIKLIIVKNEPALTIFKLHLQYPVLIWYMT